MATLSRVAVPLVLFLSVSSWAGDAPTGGNWSDMKVTGINICSSQGCPPAGLLIIKLSGEATGAPPACSNRFRNLVAVDATTDTGKFMAAVAQSVKVLGTPISVVGTGTCSLVPYIETVSTLIE
jgi:hypothetical protein